MTAEHTPGPWNCTNLDEGHGLPRTVYSELNGLSVASISGVDGDLDRWKANARLIAAAPDLLEICKSLLHIIESLPIEEQASHMTVIEQAQAIIMKAAGLCLAQPPREGPNERRKTMKTATATRVSGNLYNIIYDGRADCDGPVPFAYLERLRRDGYTVTVRQREYRGEGEPEEYTLDPAGA